MPVGLLRGLLSLARALEALPPLCPLVLAKGLSVPVARPLGVSEMAGAESEYFVLTA